MTSSLPSTTLSSHHPSESPFFIVGSGRSGSTLLRLLINGHSRLHIPPETWFISRLIGQVPLTEILDRNDLIRATDIITTDYRWPDMGMDDTAFTNSATSLVAPRLSDVIDLVYRHQLNIAGKPRFGDKTPPYIHIIPQLAILYPQSKFIHLIRDGRDVAISFVDANFHGMGTRCYHGRRFEWTSAIRSGMKLRQSCYADRILNVRFEDLICDAETTLRRICTFLGEEFETQMLTQQLSLDAIPARERHIHKKIGQPISNEAVGRWRKMLSGPECFAMESCIHEYLSSLGYPLRYSGVIWRPVLKIGALVLRAAGPILDRCVPYLQRHKVLAENLYF